MKKMFKNLMLVAVAAMAFVGCSQVEIDEVQRPVSERFFTLNIDTENDETRTYVDGSEIKWHEDGETIGILARGYNADNEEYSGSYNIVVESSAAILANNRASFTANIPVITDWGEKGIEANEYAVAAFYPYKHVSWPGTAIAFDVLKEQTPVENSFDPAADILVSKQEKMFDAVGDNIDVNFRFARLVSLVEMNVKGIPAGDKISTIEVNASQALSGTFNYTLIDDNDHESPFDERAYSYGNEGVTLLMNDRVATGEDKVWFVTRPVDLSGGSISLKVRTDNGVYIANVDLTEKQLDLKRADINRFGITVAAAPELNLVFTSASVTGGSLQYGYPGITFVDSDGNKFYGEFNFDTSTGIAGEYNGVGYACGCITSPTYTVNGGEAVSVVSISATVVDNNPEFSFTIETELADGSILNGTYTGVVEGLSRVPFEPEYIATNMWYIGESGNQDKYGISGGGITMNNITFLDADYVNTTLAAGVYHHVNGTNLIYSGNAFAFNVAELIIDGVAVSIESGNLEIIVDGDVHTLNFTITDSDNKKYMIQYVGTLNNAPAKADIELNTIVAGSDMHSSYFYYEFNLSDGADTSLDLLVTYAYSTSYTISAGDYVWMSKSQVGNNGYYFMVENVKIAGVSKSAKGGTMNVAVDGNNYTITLDLTFADGGQKFIFNGVMQDPNAGAGDNIEFNPQLVFTSISYDNGCYTLTGGNNVFKVYINAANITDNKINAGEYTFSSSNAVSAGQFHLYIESCDNEFSGVPFNAELEVIVSGDTHYLFLTFQPYSFMQLKITAGYSGTY